MRLLHNLDLLYNFITYKCTCQACFLKLFYKA